MKVKRFGMRKAKISSKGQVTIPAEVRRALGVEQGDWIVLEERPEGVLVTKAPDAADLVGSLPPLRIPWKDARRKAWDARARRITRSTATRTSSRGS